MQALIMAAGLGSRLKENTKDIPKALVKVNGRPLIWYVLKFITGIKNISHVVIVGGYFYEKLNELIQADTSQWPFEIILVKNEDFDKGNIISLKCGLKSIDDSFILFNTDHIYNPDIAKKFDEVKGYITAFCDFDRNLNDDDMKVYISNENIIKIDKKLKEYTGGYVGMTYVPKEKLEIYISTVEDLDKRYSGRVHAEYVLQELSNMGEAIKYIDISGFGWVEVDTQEDLKRAERVIKEKKWY